MSEKWELIHYEKADGTRPAEEYVFDLEQSDPTGYGKVFRKIELLENVGTRILQYGEKVARKLTFEREEFYEIKAGPHRVFYFFFSGKKIILLHGFRKKSQKTPDAEKRQAVNEKIDYLKRCNNENLE